MKSISKLRIFADPNGSGKTTLYESIQSIYFSTRLFVNVGRIEQAFRQTHFLNFSEFRIKTSDLGFQSFCKKIRLYIKANFDDVAWDLKVIGNVLVSENAVLQTQYNSYHFAIVANFIRDLLIQSEIPFSFETVSSHAGKLEQIDLALSHGYKIYLYFIGTETPSMNIGRVSDRIKKGGHSVSPEKIKDRYYLTMNLLLTILKKVDEAYLWDNSGERHEYRGKLNESTKSVTTSL